MPWRTQIGQRKIRMNKAEYVQIIEKALVGNVSPQEVQDTVAYYRDYIDMEIRKGRSEQEVLDQLGNPRLLVKSIIAAKEQRETYDEAKELHEDTMQGKSFRIPLLVVILIVVLVLGLILRLVLPMVIPALLILGIVALGKRYGNKKE